VMMNDRSRIASPEDRQRSRPARDQRLQVAWEHVPDPHAAARLLQAFSLLFPDEFAAPGRRFDKTRHTVHPCTRSK
jgi:hypothetical protein